MFYSILPCDLIILIRSYYNERTAEGILRTNMPLFFEQDIYCLAIGHHDSVLVSKYEM